MDAYITGGTIKRLREEKNMTQCDLADKLGVSAKAISKWETGRGFPDISLIEPLAAALSVSVIELMSGDTVTNGNVSGNMLRTRFYVCPICGNVIWSCGNAVISCCGVTLPPLEAEEPDDEHKITVENIEDEYYVTVDHPMEKTHFISFIAHVTSDKVLFTKLYPEGACQSRFKRLGGGWLYIYCNHHGLMKIKI